MDKLKPRFSRADTSSKNLKQILTIIDGPDEVVQIIENISFQKGPEIRYTAPDHYTVELSGEAFDENANPSIEKDLGIKPGCYHFTDKDEKDRFINMIMSQKEYTRQCIVIRCERYYNK